MFNKMLRTEHGQSIVLITMLMVGLVAMLGLAFDGGNAYVQRRRMQNASDAGAFAGARTFAGTNDSSSTTECAILQSIRRYALLNGVQGSSTECDDSNPYIHAFFVDQNGAQVGVEMPGNSGVPPAATGIRVIAQTTFNTFFLGVVSESMGSASARATVQHGELTSADHLMPMTTVTQTFVYGQNYQLQGNVTGPGGFQWLSFDCASSEPDLVRYLNQTTPSGTWSVGQSVCAGPGVQSSSAVNTALENWLAKPDDQRKWTIAIYDTASGSGSNLTYHIVGFAEFTMSGFDFNGSNKYVNGYFSRWVRAGNLTPTRTCLFGVCGTQLTQ